MPQAMFGTAEGQYPPTPPPGNPCRAPKTDDAGPWNISRRLETRVGSRLRVVAVIEVDPPRAEAALKAKLADPAVRGAYEDTVVLPTVVAFKEKVDSGELKMPKYVLPRLATSIVMYLTGVRAHTRRAIFVATPPQFRGGLQPSNDVDVQINKLFPDAHLFFEKPVATSPDATKSIEEAKAVGEILKKHKGHVSIGCVSLL